MKRKWRLHLLHPLLPRQLLFLLELLLVICLQVNQAHRVAQQLELDLLIELRAARERRSVIHLKQPRLPLSIQDHVKSENFEARETNIVITEQRVIHVREVGLDR